MSNVAIVACAACWLASCQPETSAEAEHPAQVLADSLRKTFAPDKRVAVFEVQCKPEGGQRVTIVGKTDQALAKEVFFKQLQAQGYQITDSLLLLPDPALGGLEHGVVTISVANLRSQPKHSAELATQATLGTPLKVLEQQGEWFRVQTPDQYIAWVDKGGLQQMDKRQFARWQAAPKVLCTAGTSQAYLLAVEQSQVVSDMVAGCVAERLGESGNFYRIAFPDGRQGFLPRAAGVPLDQWLATLQPTEASLVSTAKTMMGLPYLWGGTSFKGVDCSGFTKTVYFLNGLVLPRDASQQVHTGQLVASDTVFEALRPGDLLFFGRAATDSTPERVVHVGMWIGGSEFIHASGKVRISSMDPAAPNYDPAEKHRFLRAKRILSQPQEPIIRLQEENIFAAQ